ncbi:glycosyltransferase family 31 protein, partial [Patellaria atrata CBS 101060]
VLLVLKTGATEALQKLPYHLHSTLHCIPNYMIVSDLEQDIGSYKNFHVTDILANVNKTILNKYDEFKFYQQVKEYARNGQDLSLLKGDNAWKLDKWKNIPALYKAYKEYPNVKFYFFIDADSAFSLTNFLQWMKRLDAKKDLYCGSQVMYGDTIFAHGGSGYVISNSAAKKFVDANHGDYPGRWEHKIADNCCGDVMQSESLLDVGVPLTEAFPMFQGETPSTLDFHERIWCTPSITFHHMAGHEISALWHFEKNWTDTNGWNKPYLMCDVYHHFVAPYLQPTRNPWDNLSKDTVMDANNPPEDRALTPEEMIATGSFDECKAACTAKDDCLQFNWVPGRCQLGSRVIIGHVSENDEQKSGWLVERIKQQIAGYQKCTPNFS